MPLYVFMYEVTFSYKLCSNKKTTYSLEYMKCNSLWNVGCMIDFRIHIIIPNRIYYMDMSTINFLSNELLSCQ